MEDGGSLSQKLREFVQGIHHATDPHGSCQALHIGSSAARIFLRGGGHRGTSASHGKGTSFSLLSDYLVVNIVLPRSITTEIKIVNKQLVN